MQSIAAPKETSAPTTTPRPLTTSLSSPSNLSFSTRPVVTSATSRRVGGEPLGDHRFAEAEGSRGSGGMYVMVVDDESNAGTALSATRLLLGTVALWWLA